MFLGRNSAMWGEIRQIEFAFRGEICAVFRFCWVERVGFGRLGSLGKIGSLMKLGNLGNLGSSRSLGSLGSLGSFGRIGLL